MKPSSFLLKMFTFTLFAVTGKSFFKFLTSLSHSIHHNYEALLFPSQDVHLHLVCRNRQKLLQVPHLPFGPISASLVLPVRKDTSGGEELLFSKGKLLIDGTNLPESNTSPKAKVRAEDKSTTRLDFLHKGTVPIFVV